MRRPLDLPREPLTLRRRSWLAAAIGWPVLVRAAEQADARAAARSSHFPFGPVVPTRRLDPWPVLTHRGQRTNLPALLAGKVSAVQLMFTGCSATCPIQGALFAQAQSLLKAAVPSAQFVSISIDALGDTPAALDAWLKKFSAAPGWLAAVPRPADVDAIVDRLGSGGERLPTGPDPHTGQVYLFDRRAELVLRTPSMPPAAEIVDALRAVHARG
jgi:protein SCO1/2